MILGLDIATTTGWALYDPHKPVSAIRAGSFKCIGDSPEAKAYSLSGHLIKLIGDYGKPDFVCIEEPLRAIPQGKRSMKFMGEEQQVGGAAGSAQMMVLANQLVGSAIGLIRGYGLPFETVTSATWRKAMYNGDRAKGSAEWKRLARDKCRLLKIEVPNADAAEASFIAMFGPNCQRYKYLQAEAA